MQRSHGRFVTVCALVLMGQAASGQPVAESSAATTVAQFIATVAKKLETETVPTSWESFDELSKIKSNDDLKRGAVISAAITELEIAESAVFPTGVATESRQNVLLLVRLTVLVRLRELMPQPIIRVNDIVLQDYLDSEVADLKLLAWKRIPRTIYDNTRATRESKRTLLMMQEKGFAKEYLNAQIPPFFSAKLVARKALLLALMETCAGTLDTCAKAAR
jgi:hypothetical protein